MSKYIYLAYILRVLLLGVKVLVYGSEYFNKFLPEYENLEKQIELLEKSN